MATYGALPARKGFGAMLSEAHRSRRSERRPNEPTKPRAGVVMTEPLQVELPSAPWVPQKEDVKGHGTNKNFVTLAYTRTP